MTLTVVQWCRLALVLEIRLGGPVVRRLSIGIAQVHGVR